MCAVVVEYGKRRFDLGQRDPGSIPGFRETLSSRLFSEARSSEPMDRQIQLAIFRAQVENVKFLETARKQISKSINLSLRTNNLHMANVQTKIYAQMFCAWSEANFLKLIHTPHGYELDEIVNVKKAWDAGGITSGWRRAVEVGLTKIPTVQSGFDPYASTKIFRIIDKYVRDPSILRNKIAHGQWKVALNRDNTAVNTAVTHDIERIDIIVVDTWFECQKHLALIVESLIETPERTFINAYWSQLEALEATIEERSTFTLDGKIAVLRRKPIRR